MEKNQIKKIRIKGFRSIKDQEIELENMNVLIGEADTGKSNLFMAFTLLQEILNQRLGLYSAQRGAKALLRSGKDPAESISMEFVFGDGMPTDLSFAQQKMTGCLFNGNIFRTGKWRHLSQAART